MSTSLDRITTEAMELPPASRERLAYHLLRSVQEAEIGPEILASWIEVVNQREEELASGKVQSIPAEEVFREMREKFG